MIMFVDRMISSIGHVCVDVYRPIGEFLGIDRGFIMLGSF